MENTRKNTEVIANLNELIEINNDRIAGYKTALKETEHEDLKELFKNMLVHSFDFKNDLADEVLLLNGQIATGTRTSGKIYRAWMDIRAALSGKQRGAILSSCEYGEDVALETYDEVLKKNILSPTVDYMIRKQRELLQQDHDSVKALRDKELKSSR